MSAKYIPVSFETFDRAYCLWRSGAPDRGTDGADDRAFQNTVPSWALSPTAEYFLATDAMSGYCIKQGELCAVWSRLKGRGKELVQDAVWRGAESLNCFDGYLVKLYAGCGFVETARVANYEPGGPDVVIMAQPGSDYVWSAE